MAEADLAIEAIYENAEAKKALYATIEPQFQADEILASNTSSIPLDELSQRPRSGRSASSACTSSIRWRRCRWSRWCATMDSIPRSKNARWPSARRSASCPIAVKGTPGFLVNRILMPYLLESLRLYSEGVPGPVLDREAKKFGMPMGPIELADTVGLDVCASVGKELAPFLGLELPPGLEDKLEAGKRGKKDGQGLYVWQDGKPQKPEVDPDYVAPADVQQRMILPMVNEAVACLADGVVDDADLLDAGVIFGTGFAPFRGGPIAYVRSEGADKRSGSASNNSARQHGERFTAQAGLGHGGAARGCLPAARPERLREDAAACKRGSHAQQATGIRGRFTRSGRPARRRRHRPPRPASTSSATSSRRSPAPARRAPRPTST